MPCAMKAISSAESSWPSRFLRMISCGSISLRIILKKGAQQLADVGCRGVGNVEDLAVADAFRHQTRRVVCHHRKAHDLEAFMPGKDGLGRRRHAEIGRA